MACFERWSTIFAKTISQLYLSSYYASPFKISTLVRCCILSVQGRAVLELKKIWVYFMRKKNITVTVLVSYVTPGLCYPY